MNYKMPMCSLFRRGTDMSTGIAFLGIAHLPSFLRGRKDNIPLRVSASMSLAYGTCSLSGKFREYQWSIGAKSATSTLRATSYHYSGNRCSSHSFVITLMKKDSASFESFPRENKRITVVNGLQKKRRSYDAMRQPLVRSDSQSLCSAIMSTLSIRARFFMQNLIYHKDYIMISSA